jgi:multidrug efflux pump subunit AcrA (membrane-fusion protein)
LVAGFVNTEGENQVMRDWGRSTLGRSAGGRKLLTVLGCWLVLLVGRTAAQPPGELPPAPVVVAKVVQQPLKLSESFVGTVMPIRRSTVGSQVAGRVEEFLVEEGDRVQAEQPLARLRAITLKLELKAAEAELALRQAELDELERSKPKEIEQARARMDSAEAQITFNEKRLKRFQDLYRRQALSDDELQEQQYATEAARKNYAVAKSAWELASSGVWDAKVDQGRARVNMQQELINKLRDEIEQHTIKAPFDGYVTQEHVEVGQWVTEGGAVVELVQIDSVEVVVHVPERYKPNLDLGATARVELEAVVGGGWPAKIASIVPQADVRSRSFPVKIRLENEQAQADTNEQAQADTNEQTQADTPAPTPAFMPGMMARVHLPVGQKEMATMVLKDAVVLSENRPPVVWVIQSDSEQPPKTTAAPVSVELGVAYGDWIEVHGPLQSGQLVVVEGNERIRPTQSLKIRERAESSGPPQLGPGQKQPAGSESDK